MAFPIPYETNSPFLHKNGFALEVHFYRKSDLKSCQ